jgi:hypothetical protein
MNNKDLDEKLKGKGPADIAEMLDNSSTVELTPEEKEELERLRARREELKHWTVAAAGRRLVQRLEEIEKRKENAGPDHHYGHFKTPTGTTDLEMSPPKPFYLGNLVETMPDNGKAWAWGMTANDFAGGVGVPWNTGMESLMCPVTTDSVIVLVGGTGRGKSGFAIQFASSQTYAPALYVSCEMASEEIVARMIAQASGKVAYSAILKGRYRSKDVAVAVERLCKCRGMDSFYLWSPESKDRNMQAAEEMAKAISVEHDMEAPFVVLDYVQRLAKNSEDRRGAVSDISGEIRDLSRPRGWWRGACVLALSSTARHGYSALRDVRSLLAAYKGGYSSLESKTKTPPEPLEGLGKESGELEYDCTVLMVLTCDPPGNKESNYGRYRSGLVVVAKNRFGPTGAVGFDFHPGSGIWKESTGSLPDVSQNPGAKKKGRW